LKWKRNLLNPMPFPWERRGLPN